MDMRGCHCIRPLPWLLVVTFLTVSAMAHAQNDPYAEPAPEQAPNGTQWSFDVRVLSGGMPIQTWILSLLYYQPDSSEGAPDPWACKTSIGQQVTYWTVIQGWIDPSAADAYQDAIYPGTRLESANADYNCHSYATGMTTSYCIGNGVKGIKRIYTDSNNYEFIGRPEDRAEGDIVCWFGYYHSAIIESVDPSSGAITEIHEKLGPYGAYDRTTDLPSGSLLVYRKKP